jgi:hypothetical protein
LFQIKEQEALMLFSANPSKLADSIKREFTKIYNPSKIKADEIKSVVDLLIPMTGSYIVVENKVKDFPTIEQLERIIRSFTLESVESFILVSLFNTDHLKLNDSEFEGKKWNVLTYSDLATRINPIKLSEGTSIPHYYELLIQDYKKF